MFSAHGVSRAVVAEAENRRMIAVDATCPRHQGPYQRQRHAAQKKHILLIGHAGHPEVEGTMGQVEAGEVTLIETAEDALGDASVWISPSPHNDPFGRRHGGNHLDPAVPFS